jgi:hypothetical protein
LSDIKLTHYPQIPVEVQGNNNENRPPKRAVGALARGTKTGDALDPQQRELLLTRANDIEQLLKQDEIEPHHYRTLSERLSEDLAQLEASHPQVTLLMRTSDRFFGVPGNLKF